MAKELAFVLVNPYPIRKSRTGGIMARYLARTDLKLAGARLFGPSQALADEFADYLRVVEPDDREVGDLLANYVLRAYAPDPATGRPHRCICLLFEGEDAIRKIYEVTGSLRQRWCTGLSVRDTYGDFVRAEETGKVVYFEPAVIVGTSQEIVSSCLRIWGRHASADAGIVRSASDLLTGEDVQRTLVLLKPDNFHQPSLRAGNIMDLLSGSGLRIICVKKFAMTVAQAEAFYGPVRESLKRVFPIFGKDRAAQALAQEFGFPVEPASLDSLCAQLAPSFAAREFENIVEFMSGRRPSACTPEEKSAPGNEECLAIVYEGVSAVSKIRDVLGSTDPRKARPGSIRREFGTNIMVNAAHASDSPENAVREMGIIDVDHDAQFEERIRRYYGP
ncbi:MAG: nucleoside-diphosphate kinase [Kiritimatiellia bacterium]